MTLTVDIRHRLGDFALDVQFDAPAGVTVLVGRSGAGKTSVINAVAGLMRPDAGRVTLGDRVLMDRAAGICLPPHQRRIGYVFQEGRLFPHMTVRQNLTYGARFAARQVPMGPVVEMLGIGHLLDRRPRLLSGGEQSRVALGRALLSGPDLLLADEPLAALDAARKAEILPYFERLRDEMSLPVLYVTHAMSEVARLASHVVVIDGGRVRRQGTAAQVLGDPAGLPAGVRAVGAVLEATVAAHHADGLTELAAGGVPLFLPKVDAAVGSRLRVRIAAHDVILSAGQPVGLSALNVIAGTITAIRAGDGPGAIVTLDTAAGRVLARVTRRSLTAMGLSIGATVHAVVKTVAIAPEDVG